MSNNTYEIKKYYLIYLSIPTFMEYTLIAFYEKTHSRR